jgi:hypothetical protein
MCSAQSTLNEHEGTVAFVRSHRVIVIVLALAAAFVVLQVPPLNSWRFHRLATWRLTSNSATADSPPFTISTHAPVRLQWSATGPVKDHGGILMGSNTFVEGVESYSVYSGPWVLDAFQAGVVGLAHRTHFSALVGFRPMFEGDFVNLWPGESHGYFLVAPWSGSDPSSAARPWQLRSRTTPDQPTITFTVSQPYGFWYLPLEDYLVAASLVACLVWAVVRGTRRAVRRRRAVLEDDAGEAASVV